MFSRSKENVPALFEVLRAILIREIVWDVLVDFIFTVFKIKVSSVRMSSVPYVYFRNQTFCISINILNSRKGAVIWLKYIISYINKIQRDAKACRCLFTGKLLYMFRVYIAPIIRNTSKCNCSFWYRP